MQHTICIHLTHWGRAMLICVGKLTIIGSDNGLSPGRRQAIIWTNAVILITRPIGTNVSEIFIGIQTFSFRKMHLKISSAKWRPFCLGLNELIPHASTNSCDKSNQRRQITPYSSLEVDQKLCVIAGFFMRKVWWTPFETYWRLQWINHPSNFGIF